MTITQKNAQAILDEVGRPAPNLNRIRALAQEIERLATVPQEDKSKEFSLSIPVKIRERDGRMKIDFTEDDRLIVQDCLRFHKMRGGMVQLSLSKAMQSRVVKFAYPGRAPAVPTQALVGSYA